MAALVPDRRSGRRAGRRHAKVTTTLAIYTYLFDDDHAETMAALGAMATPPKVEADNVVALRR